MEIVMMQGISCWMFLRKTAWKHNNGEMHIIRGGSQFIEATSHKKYT